MSRPTLLSLAVVMPVLLAIAGWCVHARLGWSFGCFRRPTTVCGSGLRVRRLADGGLADGCLGTAATVGAALNALSWRIAGVTRIAIRIHVGVQRGIGVGRLGLGAATPGRTTTFVHEGVEEGVCAGAIRRSGGCVTGRKAARMCGKRRFKLPSTVTTWKQ
jgi:hypothetical protein